MPNPMPNPMKAIAYRRYGGPEVLEHIDAPRPKPGEGQVLVRVRASSINSADCRIMRADPFLVRFFNGIWRPKNQILGVEAAGEVVELGPGARRFSVGDEVFGEAFDDGMGGFAEYVALTENKLAIKPKSVTFAQASTLPVAGVTALQAVRDLAKVRAGESVLIQGAGGGVGTYLVQVAKAAGATVTAVCGERNVELMKSLGADHVVDYAHEDFTQNGERYDVIFGVNGYHSVLEYRRCLKPGGRYAMIGGGARQLFEALLLGKLAFMFSGKSVHSLKVDDSIRDTDLAELGQMMAAGQLRPVIERTFPLHEAVEAIRFVELGHVRGKVVLEMPSDQASGTVDVPLQVNSQTAGSA